MNPPGAPMSGLIERPGDRPYELNEEINAPVGLTNVAVSFVQVMLTDPEARRPSISTPSESRINTTGIVTAGVPATLAAMYSAMSLYTTTPAAPALCAFKAFWWKEHDPRRIKTTLPARLPAGSSLQASAV